MYIGLNLQSPIWRPAKARLHGNPHPSSWQCPASDLATARQASMGTALGDEGRHAHCAERLAHSAAGVRTHTPAPAVKRDKSLDHDCHVHQNEHNNESLTRMAQSTSLKVRSQRRLPAAMGDAPLSDGLKTAINNKKAIIRHSLPLVSADGTAAAGMAP
jgi:hypothetical protein